MTCVHLKQLYQLCQQHDIKLSGADLIRVTCTQCGDQEVCPNTLTDEYDAKQAAGTNNSAPDSSAPNESDSSHQS